MSRIILDFGSGNTCQNKKEIVKDMISQLSKVDTKKHEIVIKWQLFNNAGNNIPLDRNVFAFAYSYAKNKYGYKTTASVFDLDSLYYLLNFDIPFVKIANNSNLYYLMNYIPNRYEMYYSGVEEDETYCGNLFYCISKYPAYVEDYIKLPLFQGCNISDHTSDFALWYRYNPKMIEWHFKLPSSTGLDSGKFARTPMQLAEIL